MQEMKRSALLFVSVAILASCIAFRSWQPFRSWQHRGAAERLLSVIQLSSGTHQVILNEAAPFSQVTSSPTGRADVDFTVDVGCVLIAQFAFCRTSDVFFHERVDAVDLQGAEVEVGCRHSFAGTLCGVPSGSLHCLIVALIAQTAETIPLLPEPLNRMARWAEVEGNLAVSLRLWCSRASPRSRHGYRARGAPLHGS